MRSKQLQLFRVIIQFSLLALSVFLVVHGITGPEFAPKNLTTLLVWIHYRGALVFSLLFFGNFFCMVCPHIMLKNIMRRFWNPPLALPRWMKNKWISILLMICVLFFYELEDLWASPVKTSILIALFFLSGTVVDSLFKKSSFCKYFCPIGQFNFLSSTLSPFEVQVVNPETCNTCLGHECLGGRGAKSKSLVSSLGCELDLFIPMKMGNMDCTFCMACLNACPEDNIIIKGRVPGKELSDDSSRSGIGRFSKRTDIAALAVVFTFGSLLNAFGMTGPLYDLKLYLALKWGLNSSALFLTLLYLAFLVFIPILCLYPLTRMTWTLCKGSKDMPFIFRTFSFSLVPLGFSMWISHYSFHFFTGLFTFVPIVLSLLGWDGHLLLNEIPWWWKGLPGGIVDLIKVGSLVGGLLGSWFVSFRICSNTYRDIQWRIFIPWSVFHFLIFIFAVLIMNFPMEMRGMS